MSRSLRQLLSIRTFINDSHLHHASTKHSHRPSSTTAPEDSSHNEVLPLLQRPLGIKDPPMAQDTSWTEQMMDQDKRLEKRRQLIKEASKGYFADLNATRRQGGKTWIAPRVMIREDKALYFPNITGTTLDTREKKNTIDLCKGRISVISMLSTKISEVHTAGFTTPTHTRFSSHPLFTRLSINLQENLLKSFLVSLFLSSLRASVPLALHPTYLVSSQNMDYLRDDMGMTNSRVGYVYLVDERCRIRWAGCADAMREESEALEKCTGVLLGRLKIEAGRNHDVKNDV